MEMPNRLVAGDSQQITQDLQRRYSVQHAVVCDGYTNLVTLADERLVFKVPQGENKSRLAVLAREALTLQFLRTVDFGDYVVPGLVEFSADPTYLVATYVPGRSYDRSELSLLDIPTRERLGRSMAHYLLYQAQTLDPAAVDAALPPMDGYSWPTVFETNLRDFHDNRYPTLTRLAGRQYERWQQAVDAPTDKVVIHGDFKTANLAFRKDHSVCGPIDLARMHAGTLEDECSVLLAFERDDRRPVLEACLAELKASGREIDKEKIQLWQDTRDMHVLPYWIMRGQLDNPYFVRLRDVIVQRYPQQDWSELYR